MTAHRYWRIRLIETNSYPMAASEIQMRTSIGGPSVCVGGTPIADSVYQNVSEYAVANAFDGDNGTYWAGAGANTSSFIGYDFGLGNEKEILEVSYQARKDLGNQTPNSAVLEWSDDSSSWTIAFKIHYGEFKNGEVKVRSQVYLNTYPGRNPHRYWRINHPNHTSDYCSGVTAELRATPNGENLTLVQMFRAFDAGHYEDWGARRLYDSDPSSIYAGGNGWAAVEFFNPTTVEEFSWTIRTGGGPNYQAPVSGTVDYSDDGTTWNPAWNWAFSQFAEGETKIATNPDYQAPPAIGRRRQSIIVT